MKRSDVVKLTQLSVAQVEQVHEFVRDKPLYGLQAMPQHNCDRRYIVDLESWYIWRTLRTIGLTIGVHYYMTEVPNDSAIEVTFHVPVTKQTRDGNRVTALETQDHLGKVITTSAK